MKGGQKERMTMRRRRRITEREEIVWESKVDLEGRGWQERVRRFRAGIVKRNLRWRGVVREDG